MVIDRENSNVLVFSAARSSAVRRGFASAVGETHHLLPHRLERCDHPTCFLNHARLNWRWRDDMAGNRSFLFRQSPR
jgi:hypothetical protein